MIEAVGNNVVIENTEKVEQNLRTGVVVSVGEKVKDLKPKVNVVFGEYAGQIMVGNSGKEVFIVDYNQILAKW